MIRFTFQIDPYGSYLKSGWQAPLVNSQLTKDKEFVCCSYDLCKPIEEL
jgi:hypothetical protein